MILGDYVCTPPRVKADGRRLVFSPKVGKKPLSFTLFQSLFWKKRNYNQVAGSIQLGYFILRVSTQQNVVDFPAGLPPAPPPLDSLIFTASLDLTAQNPLRGSEHYNGYVISPTWQCRFVFT